MGDQANICLIHFYKRFNKIIIMELNLVDGNTQFTSPNGFQMSWNVPNPSKIPAQSYQGNQNQCETLSLPLMMILMTSKTIKSSTVLPMMMMNSCFASSSGMMPFLMALMKDDSSVSHEDLMMMMANNRGINTQNNKLMHLMLMKSFIGDKKDLK